MDKIKELLIAALMSLVAGMYLFGMYTLVIKDNYSAKQLIAGIILPPYPLYIGVKETYDAINTKLRTAQQNKKYTLEELADFLNKGRGLPSMAADGTTLIKPFTTTESALVLTLQKTTTENSNILKHSLQTMFAHAKTEYCAEKKYNTYNQMLFKKNVSFITKVVDKNNVLIDQQILNKSSCL